MGERKVEEKDDDRVTRGHLLSCDYVGRKICMHTHVGDVWLRTDSKNKECVFERHQNFARRTLPPPPQQTSLLQLLTLYIRFRDSHQMFHSNALCKRIYEKDTRALSHMR
jgi:hypothetical protein